MMKFLRSATWLFTVLLCTCLAAGLTGATDGAGGKIVQFDSAIYPLTPFQKKQSAKTQSELKKAAGQELEGILYRPRGDGPFPAVVLMHGCGGIWHWNRVWAERLNGWGYAVLDVDSLGPRQFKSICGRGTAVTGQARAYDAYGAKAYLVNLPFIDPGRIAVMGMSHGGWSVLRTVDERLSKELETEPFKAAVALYPWCPLPTAVATPLLILIGEIDDWSPVERCRNYVDGAKSAHELSMKIYPNTHHLFDHAHIDRRVEGHVLRYDQKAADDAIALTKAFLAKHL
ncbi:MAG: dienelactone hydrolase family protein [Hyphomicrobiales bacterium]